MRWFGWSRLTQNEIKERTNFMKEMLLLGSEDSNQDTIEHILTQNAALKAKIEYLEKLLEMKND
jgi:hypothetical protein